MAMESAPNGMIGALNERSRAIFSQIVTAYLDTGEPTGSRTLSRRLDESLSPATIRNVMADLEEMGLLYAPHTSAGRMPTEAGLRLFVDGLLEVGSLTEDDRKQIEAQCAAAGKPMKEALEEATTALSGLSRCAGLVVAPKAERGIRHIEFVSLGDGRALVVLVSEDGAVENRVVRLPVGTPPSALVQAANYLNARLTGRTLDQARRDIQAEIEAHQAQLDALTAGLVEAGLATWAGDQGDGGPLIIKGHARLLDDVQALTDLERVRALFEALDTKDLTARLVERTRDADGVQIYIGAENNLFNMAGCAMVTAPFNGANGDIVGAIGVIGPTRINYARIIPIVDYTAKVIGRLMDQS
jgi:heat-inducible transcriptional repressor